MVLLTGCSVGTDGGRTSEPAPAGTTAAAESSDSEASAPAWQVELEDPSFKARLPNEGPNPIAAGKNVVILGFHQATAYDVATGDVAWETELPHTVCAASRTANTNGVIAVLLGADGECTDAAAFSTSDGRILWTVPIPRAGQAFGHEVSVGPDMVVVTGECAGFSRMRLTDGSVAGTVTGATTNGRCASAASDGSSIVMSSRGRFWAYDASSGERQRTWRADDLGRVGDLLTGSPLVATARFARAAHLVRLSGRGPSRFGRDAGGFGGEVAASYRLGNSLWVQYDEERVVGFDQLAAGYQDVLLGYDLTTSREVTIRFRDETTLVGVHDGLLVVVVGRGSPTDARLSLIDPSAPQTPQLSATLPPPEDGYGPEVGVTVVGDYVIRVWRDGAEAIAIP